MMIFAQISDTHLDGSSRRAERARAVMACLNGLVPPLTAVLVTGDIADHGLPPEYEQARDIFLSSPLPVLTCPGNHDNRAAYCSVLLGEDRSPGDGADPVGPVNRARRVGGALFALCDSTIPGRDDGHLADETLTWLDGVLSDKPRLPAFVCFHHPATALGIPTADRIRQSGEQRLAAVLAAHPQVVAILCGHAHTPAATTFAGRPALVSPGVASTLLLPGEPGGVASEHAPPGVAFHVLDEDRRLTTHYRAVV